MPTYVCKRNAGWHVIDTATGETLFGPYIEKRTAECRKRAKDQFDRETAALMDELGDDIVVSNKMAG